MIASGKEAEAAAYLDWAKSQDINVVRVLLMAQHLFELTPEAGRAALPKLLDLAAPWLEAGAYGLFHKGRDVDSELTESAKSWRITCARHPSVVDPGGCILEVKEIDHVS